MNDLAKAEILELLLKLMHTGVLFFLLLLGEKDLITLLVVARGRIENIK